MAPNVPSVLSSTNTAAPTASAAALNPKVFYGAEPSDNPIGVFVVLLFIVLLLASGTGVFIWKIYIRSAMFGNRTVQTENKSPPKQLFLPSLYYANHSTSSSASTIEPKPPLNAPPFQTKDTSLFSYVRTVFKKPDPISVDVEPPSTDKEGEFVLVEAPIPGGDVPTIIVSTCSPSLRPQEFPTSVSTDSLQVPTNRFTAPRPQPRPVIAPPHMLPQVYHPLRIASSNTAPHFGNQFGPRPTSQAMFDTFGSHHNYQMDISALGFQHEGFSCSSLPRRVSCGKENTPMPNGRPGHARGRSRSYKRCALRYCIMTRYSANIILLSGNPSLSFEAPTFPVSQIHRVLRVYVLRTDILYCCLHLYPLYLCLKRSLKCLCLLVIH